ncbi:MAG: sugar-binding transcriptional regulator [Eubacteriales bacterium]
MSKYEKTNLMVHIAKLYYEDNYNQNMIAEKLKLSRPYVSRLLNLAKEEGLVTVAVHVPQDYESRLEAEVRESFGLLKAIIVPQSLNVNIVNRIGVEAAKYLNSIIKDDDIICVSWGSTLYEFSLNLIPRSDIRNVTIVQGCGGISQISKNIFASEIPKKLADAYGGIPYILPLPAIVDKKETRDLILMERSISQIMDISRKANIAIFTMGYFSPECALARAGYVSETEVILLKEKGAVGDIFTRLITIDGQICDRDLDDRTIALDLDDLKKKEYRIGIACGCEREKSVYGALVSETCNVLVTDEATAVKMMESYYSRKTLQ